MRDDNALPPASSSVKRRQAVRALIVSEPDQSVLLLRMQRPDGSGDFWLLPGGGVKPDEGRLDALRREVWEETGLVVSNPPRLIWQRQHRFGRAGGCTEQHEDIYLVVTPRFQPTSAHNPEQSEVGIFHEFRWWSAAALAGAGNEVFAPRSLPRLVARIFANGPPTKPLSLRD